MRFVTVIETKRLNNLSQLLERKLDNEINEHSHNPLSFQELSQFIAADSCCELPNRTHNNTLHRVETRLVSAFIMLQYYVFFILTNFSAYTRTSMFLGPFYDALPNERVRSTHSVQQRWNQRVLK